MSERRPGLVSDQYLATRLARPIGAHEQQIEICGYQDFMVGDELEFTSTGERVRVTDVEGKVLTVRRGIDGTVPGAVDFDPADGAPIRILGNNLTDRREAGTDPDRGWRDWRHEPTRTDRYLVVLQGAEFRYTTIATFVHGRGWCGSEEVGPKGELIRSWRELPPPPEHGGGPRGPGARQFI